MVQRFQNINPEKDGATIKGPTDLKNEMQFITLPDELWAKWQSFLIKHAEGELVDPVTKKKYKLARGFRVKVISLKREFFKHCGHFMDADFGAYSEHLLGITPNRKVIYPKVSVLRTKILVADNMSGADYVEWRKRKKSFFRT